MTPLCNCCACPTEAFKTRSRLDELLDPELFQALADPNRARVLACLIKCARPCSVTEVAACCHVDYSMVARQLSALATAGLLEGHKEGRTMWYSARAGHLAKTFRALAAAVEEWTDTTDAGGGCGCADQHG